MTMKLIPRLLALYAMFALGVGPSFADPKPVIELQVVETNNADAYVALMAKASELSKVRAGADIVRRVWVADVAGENSHKLLAVTVFPSLANEYQLQQEAKSYPEMNPLLEQLKEIRRLGPSFLCKAVRADGLYAGGAFFTVSMNCGNEESYVKALDDAKLIFEANGFKDVRMNLWRFVAGGTTATHLLVFSLPSQVRLGEFIDTIYDKALLKDWLIAAAKVRTVVQTGIYHEISK